MPHSKTSRLPSSVNVSKKFTAVFIGLSIVFTLWLSSLLMVFNLPNSMLRDALMQINVSHNVSEQMVIVEAEHSMLNQGDEVWLTALKNLLAHDVKKIVFSFTPQNVSEAFYQLASDSKKVLFGRQLISRNDHSVDKLYPLPLNIENKDLLFGVATTADHDNGVFKYQFGSVQVNNTLFPSLEYLVAQQVLGESAQLPKEKYLINFIGGTARLPTLNIKRVLNKGLIDELINDRTVLVGINGLEPIAKFYTPISNEEGLISDLTLHGFALDTLLSDRQIKSFSPWLVLIFIFFATTGSLFLSQWLSFQLSVIASMLMSVVCLTLSWLALHLFSLWLPYTEILLAQWLTFFVVWRYQIVIEKQTVDRMLLDLSVQLQEKMFPVSFYRTDEPWEQLIIMINQTLNLQRIIFLERVENDHRLREIKSLNCSIDDISEMRRDYERAPYSTAISENKVLLLDQSFLNEATIEEQQYLAPLTFAGDVLGFWAFTIKPQNIRAKAKFEALTHDFMLQISEILHYRQEWQRQMLVEQNKFWNYLSIEGGNTSYKALSKYILLMEQRISILQEVFNNLNTHSILYDLFGRVILVNKHMEELALSMELRPYNITMLEFVSAITGYDEAKTRHLLQQTIFDGEVIALPVKPLKDQQNYMLYIRPLKTLEQNKSQFIDEANVFSMRGVLCELVDISELKQLWELKEKMLERFGFQIRNDMASVFLALSILEDDELSAEDRAMILTNIQGKIDETLQTLELVQEQTNIEVEHLANNKLDCYPVDGFKPLEKAIEALGTEVSKLGITLHLKAPKLFSLVFASPYELGLILRAVLSVLVEDSGQQGNVWLEIEEKDGDVNYCMYNDGAGIPQENLEQFLNSDNLSSDEITKLHHAINSVNQWGGSLNITSQVGQGLRVKLKLRRFM